MGYAYEHDPAAIYRQSFATVRAEADLAEMADDLRPIAMRLIHACGMVDIANDLDAAPDAVRRGRAALRAGNPILADCEMVAAGVARARMPANNEVICTLNDPGVPAQASRIANTRSAAAVDLWRPHLGGAVVAIGNAPTALFHLLERLQGGDPAPAVVLGFPVGFVGAAESKAALAAFGASLPYITLHGRRGGSALAAAAVNALAGELE